MNFMPSQVLPINVPSKNRTELLKLAARMSEEAELIGGRMAELRKQLGLTQREVAEMLPGSTQGSDISRWETGKHRPAQETLPHVAEALKTTVADLHLGPMAARKAPKKLKKGEGPFDSLSARDADGTAEALAAIRELVAGLGAEIEGAVGLLEQLAKDVRSVQGDIATLKRRRVG